MSIVNIFTVAQGGQQVSDGNCFIYYLNTKHEKVSYWRCVKKDCAAYMVSHNSTSLFMSEKLPSYLITIPPTYLCPTGKQGVAWDLRDMGSAWGRGVMGPPGSKKDKQSEGSAREEATWRRKRRRDKSGVMKKDQREQSELFYEMKTCYQCKLCVIFE